MILDLFNEFYNIRGYNDILATKVLYLLFINDEDDEAST
jgi:hypothetical protein